MSFLQLTSSAKISRPQEVELLNWGPWKPWSITLCHQLLISICITGDKELLILSQILSILKNPCSVQDLRWDCGCFHSQEMPVVLAQSHFMGRWMYHLGEVSHPVPSSLIQTIAGEMG